jgi:formate hydrogenlyase transcriptional activator
MKMAESLALPEDSLKVGTARRMAGLISHAQPALLVCVSYYAGAWIAKALRFPDSHLSLLWPPTAILLAALLLVPLRKWWIYLVAVIPAHVFVQLQDGVPGWGILSQLIGNFSQASLAAFSVRYFNKEASLFDNFRGVVIFTLGAVLFAPVVVSSIVAYLYVLSGWEQNYWYVWRARILSNTLSTLVIVPPILLVGRGMIETTKFEIWRFLEAGLIAVGFGLIGLTAFRTEMAVAFFLYAPLPLLLWATVRFGVGGLCLSLLVTAYLVFLDALAGQGPFAAQSPAANMLSLQLFLITVALPLMWLAVLMRERRDKESAVRESEARYRALVMASAEMVWRANARGEGVFVTPRWHQLTGQNQNEMGGLGWLEPVHPDDRERASRLWERAMIEKRTYENELRVRTRDGNYRHFYVHAVPILAPDGSVREWVGANTEITDRKRAESRLKTQYAVSRAVADSTSIDDAAARILKAICECLECEFGEIWQVNRETNVLTCVEKWHLPLMTLTEFASVGHELTFPFGVGLPGRVWESRKPICIPDVTVDPNFLRASVATTAGLRGALGFPILLSDEAIGVIVLFTGEVREADKDLLQMMTSIGSQLGQFMERKQAEQALHENEEALRDSAERLRLALKAGRMGVWDWDRRSNVRQWSKEYFLVMGLLPFSVEPSYRAWAKCVHPEDLPRARSAVETAIRDKKDYRCEYRVVWPDGTIRWVVARGESVYDAAGECVRVMGVLVDVTERKQAEEEIYRLKERLEAENVYLRTEVSRVHRYGELLGRSGGILKVLQQVNQVAGTDMTVLVLGETGTGKELVARAVHGQSGRRERPLVKVNCSALPGELIENELFGHEKGAFTGATGRQVGRFELAVGGAIFLDEVGDLQLKLQAKLLRVLQEGEFERLGSGKTIKVNVRVIAATNRDLWQAVQRGRFRADLYYRLAVYPIRLPPLRERREDIGLLAEVFLREAGRRLGRIFEPISEEVLEALRRYEWPGNVRELQNVIERAAVVSAGRSLQLPEQWAVPFGPISTTEAAEASRVINSPSREATLEQHERSHILQILHQTAWRVEGPKGAAMILGLNPSTLRSRMQKLGIRREERLMKVPLEY